LRSVTDKLVIEPDLTIPTIDIQDPIVEYPRTETEELRRPNPNNDDSIPIRAEAVLRIDIFDPAHVPYKMEIC
jgi:hypothetical protein